MMIRKKYIKTIHFEIIIPSFSTLANLLVQRVKIVIL